MKIFILLFILMVVDLITGAIVHLFVVRDFKSSRMKDGCLKKCGILLIGATTIILARYFPEFSYLEFTITPFIVSEITSLIETADLLKKEGE